MEATTLFTLSFLFLSFTANRVDASHHGISIVDDHQPLEVLDSSGNKLQKGEYYYIQPLLALPFLYSAAIVPVIYRPGTTWLQLEIEKFFFEITGLPVAFTPVASDSEDDSIRVSTDLHIQFSEDEMSSSVFGETPVWKVDGIEPFVTLGGAYEDKSSWFKIENASEVDDRTYKLVSSLGRNVGITNRAFGTKRLALVHKPLLFVFFHVKEAPAPTASIGNF
ncbi:hypothetical protein L484_004394 [Morus notabilis]|uniref:Kunitz-type serine protease inhibitor n=1 Tax=Morus notabilis TaxID=981085 RepID=W9S4K7_9ROSA|nr:21 kDa seed protein [Morus notabilis]AUR26484.1 kunitz-type serine protease inhibitor [Morus notabilis]EXC10216.1 hypothetical protein L484_004394 [Morus notabilis]